VYQLKGNYQTTSKTKRPMKTILDKIIAHKKKEVKERRSLVPTALLERSIYFETPTVSLKHFLKRTDKQGIIAEFKRKSPSEGVINQYVAVEEVSIGYMQAGASALSVLTDEHFFGGKKEDLSTARKYNYAPILNKNFIIEPYQIIEAKSIGADAILLIAACLGKSKIKTLTEEAKKLGLEVVLEIHEVSELDNLCTGIDIVGINNRNLHTFEVDIAQSLAVAAEVPPSFTKIAESGISSPSTVVTLKEAGFEGFLIGSHFMRNARPQEACAEFIQAIEKALLTTETTVAL